MQFKTATIDEPLSKLHGARVQILTKGDLASKVQLLEKRSPYREGDFVWVANRNLKLEKKYA